MAGPGQPAYHVSWQRHAIGSKGAGAEGLAMTRADFQRLALDRLADARAMLAAKRWSAAYYMAGYAVECGLKSCILARVAVAPELIFEDRRFSEKCWTHDLDQLVILAGLKTVLGTDCAANVDLVENWKTVKDWTEVSRYAHWTKTKAEKLYNAIADKKHGVMLWIKGHW
jgi:hypothetical protein